jgi:N-acetylglucosaminyldiphosphoundecaprenol N-acetyl-beta-D-mannosaminyltransferase
MGIPSCVVLGSRVHATTYDEATALVMEWARAGESRMVYAAPVHMIMEAYDSPEFQALLNSADLVTPDGMPVAWAMRWLGSKGQGRVCGPDLLESVCRACAEAQVPIGLYGSSSETLAALKSNLESRYPGLAVVYAYSPPFRPLTAEEDAQIERDIAASGARVLFVGLGCPKQERWMAAHRGRVPAVMMGVGAAFDFHSGDLKRAPKWMQRAGLEWLFRLCMNPRRLFVRYLKHNPRYLALVLFQILGQRRLARRAS